MSTINALLDAAERKTGSDYQTAKLLGKPRQEISNWRHGHKNPQPEDHALVAALAGLDPEEALVRAVLEKHANTSKGERLLSVLGNVLHRTGAAVTLLLFASVASVMTPGSAEARIARTGDNVHYVKSLIAVERGNPKPPSSNHSQPLHRAKRRFELPSGRPVPRPGPGERAPTCPYLSVKEPEMQRIKTIKKVIGTVGAAAGLFEKYQEGYDRTPPKLSDLVPGAWQAKMLGQFHRTHNDEAQMRGRWGDIDHWNELTKDNPRLPPWLK